MGRNIQTTPKMRGLACVVLMAVVASTLASPLLRTKRSYGHNSYHSPLHTFDCHDEHDHHCHDDGHHVSFSSHGHGHGHNDYHYGDYGHYDYGHYGHGHGHGHHQQSYHPQPSYHSHSHHQPSHSHSSYKPKVVIIKKIVPLSTTTQFGR